MSTRARYIALGLISNRQPSTVNWLPNGTGPQLNADQLEARGFHIAARAKRHLEWGASI